MSTSTRHNKVKFSRETRVKRALTRFSCEIFHMNFTWSYFKWNSHEQFHVNFTSHEFHMNIGWNFTWNSREAQLAVYVLVGTPTNINGSNARHSAKKQATDPGSVTIMVQQEGPELHYVLQDIPSHCKSSGPPTIY